jgi:hypothetical protein
VLAMLLLLFRSIVPRMARPESPLSCKGTAKELPANNTNIKPNIIEFFISLTLIFTLFISLIHATLYYYAFMAN